MSHPLHTRVLCIAALLCVAPVRTPEPAVGPAKPEIVIAGASTPFSAHWGAGRIERGTDGSREFVRCITTGTGDLSMVTSAEGLERTVDLRGHFIRVWLRVDHSSRLAAMELRLASGGLGEDYFTFPVPIFDDEHFSPLQSGDWLPLTLSFGSARVTGSPDRSAIDAIAWIVRDRGADEAGAARPLRADFAGLHGVALPPRGMISLTFDDGYDEHFDVAAPLMAERGFSGTAYVMPDQVGMHGYMTLDELRIMSDSYGWDIAAHHFIPFTDFEPKALEEAVSGVQSYLRSRGFARGADHLAYPLGKHDPRVVLPNARRHFATARLASAGPETLPPGDPHRLRVFNVLDSTPPEEIRAAIARAREHREWLILMFHYLVDAPELETAYSIERFEAVLDEIAAGGLPVRTVSDVWSEYAGAPAAAQ